MIRNYLNYCQKTQATKVVENMLCGSINYFLFYLLVIKNSWTIVKRHVFEGEYTNKSSESTR